MITSTGQLRQKNHQDKATVVEWRTRNHKSCGVLGMSAPFLNTRIATLNKWRIDGLAEIGMAFNNSASECCESFSVEHEPLWADIPLIW